MGIVYLVGAGPGDKKLYTLRAVELLKSADAIVYDRLTETTFMEWAKDTCIFVDAGKSPGCHPLPQEEINELLANLAAKYRIVVRLKGGDPYIFGRGGEEASYLADRGILFEEIPGVSSFYAAAASAGIPVTYRGLSSSIHIYTGHGGPPLVYETIAKTEGTHCFLMSMSRLGEICRGLMDCGMDENLPAAVIERGTSARQREVRAVLSTIAREVEQAGVKNPAVLILGNVIGCSQQLHWKKRKPLWGKRILLTRAWEEAKSLAEEVEALGGECCCIPTTELFPIKSQLLTEAMTHLGGYQWLLFTSAHSVKFFFSAMQEKKLDVRSLFGISIGCIGEKTEEALHQFGCFANWVSEKPTGSGMAAEFKKVVSPGERVLFPCSALAPDVIKSGVESAGGHCDQLVLYENHLSQQAKMRLEKEREFDVAVFFSSSQAKNYFLLEEKKCNSYCAIGSETEKTLIQLGYPPVAVAKEPSTKGVLQALKDIFSI